MKRFRPSIRRDLPFRFPRLVTSTRWAAVSLAFAATVGAGVPALSERHPLAMLEGLDAGMWELKLRAPNSADQSLCLHDGRHLIQLRHPNDSCEQVIIGDADDQVTVQYTCPGKGYGRTHITRETSKTVRIESQGISGGYPFDFAGEARWVGQCGV